MSDLVKVEVGDYIETINRRSPRLFESGPHEVLGVSEMGCYVVFMGKAYRLHRKDYVKVVRQHLTHVVQDE
jgi:hypothetical protein